MRSAARGALLATLAIVGGLPEAVRGQDAAGHTVAPGAIEGRPEAGTRLPSSA